MPVEMEQIPAMTDDADRGGHTRDRDGQLFGISLLQHRGHEHAGDARGIRDRRTGDSGEDHGGQNVHVRKTAVDVTHNSVTEFHQAGRDAALGHGVTREGIEGNRQQSPAVHALEHTLRYGLDIDASAADKDNPSDGRKPQRNADGDAQEHQDCEADEQPCNHTHTTASPSISFAICSMVLSSSFGSVSVTTK